MDTATDKLHRTTLEGLNDTYEVTTLHNQPLT